MSEKCYVCEKGTLEQKKTDFKVYGMSIGTFDAKICTKCGETFFDEKTSDFIDATSKICVFH